VNYKPEDEVQQLIQLEAARYRVALMRNNVGVLKDLTGRPVRYGLNNLSAEMNKNSKSSDLIGITPVVITPEMVGRTIGVFTAVEVKGEKWKKISNDRERAQQNFITWVISLGGIGKICNSVDSFKELIKR